jgi:hypothetical protein
MFCEQNTASRHFFPEGPDAEKAGGTMADAEPCRKRWFEDETASIH